MSQPAGTERPAGGRGAGGGNPLTRRYGGVPGYAWVALVSLVAGGVIWFRQRRKAASTAAAAAGPAAGPTQATCYDANGATVACSDPAAVGSNATDYFEALYAQGLGINSQLETIGPQVTETGQDADAIQALLQNLPGSTSTPAGGGGRPGAVTDLRVTPVSPTLARVSWRPPQFASHAPTPTTYTIQIEGKDAGPHNIGSRTSYDVGRLRPGGHYTAVVAPAGGPPASAPFTMPGGATVSSNWPGGRQPLPIRPAA